MFVKIIRLHLVVAFQRSGCRKTPVYRSVLEVDQLEVNFVLNFQTKNSVAML